MSNHRTAALQELEEEYQQAVTARERAAEQRQSLEREREDLASNGVTPAKLRKLRERLEQADRDFYAADEAVQRALPDLLLLREAAEADRQHQREVDQTQRQIERLRIQIELAETFEDLASQFADRIPAALARYQIGTAWRAIRNIRWHQEREELERLLEMAEGKLAKLEEGR